MPSHQTVIDSSKIPLSCLFSRLNKPHSLSLSLYVMCFQPHDHLGGSPIDSNQCASVFFCTREPKPGHSAPDVISQVHQRRHSLVLHTCLYSPGSNWFLCCKDTLITHIQLLFVKNPLPFYAKLLPSQLPPCLHWWMGLFCPRCRTLHLVLLNFMNFPSAHFSKLLMRFH